MVRTKDGTAVMAPDDGVGREGKYDQTLWTRSACQSSNLRRFSLMVQAHRQLGTKIFPEYNAYIRELYTDGS